MIDRIRTVVDDAIVSPLRRYLGGGSTNERSDDHRDSGSRNISPGRSPEGQVLELLEERDGRMWQQSIVDETGYSEPHVSRLLSRMEDDGLLDRRWSRGEKVVILEEDSTGDDESELTASA